MSSRGRSLSMFVVQRAHSRVRRGYDPAEVDRHLELVSQWFTSTDIGPAFTHERAELDQRERAVSAREAALAHDLEGARLEAEATLEGARRRADAGARAAHQALAEARQEAAAIRADAERQRTALLEQARAEAAAAEAIRVAEGRAATIVEHASEEREGILAEARGAAERELTAAEKEREQRLAEVRSQAAELAERLREEADEELRIYTERRRREADRLAQAARRGREAAVVSLPTIHGRAPESCARRRRALPRRIWAPRSLGGCDHPDGVVPLCWTHHRAYDTGRLELLPHLEPQWRAEVAHAVSHLGLIGAVRRLAPRRR